MRLDSYSPTDHAHVVAALAAAAVGPGDVVVDLGAGDGRWLAEAVRRGATAIGYENDEELSGKARAVMPEGATILTADLREADLSMATVVVAILSPQHHDAIRARCASGTRFVRYVGGADFFVVEQL